MAVVFVVLDVSVPKKKKDVSLMYYQQRVFLANAG